MDLDYEELTIISFALYQTYNSLKIPTEKRKINFNDKENVLSRKINVEMVKIKL